ncbi:SURF1 family protein [Phenylobacterium soli]|uniref:SURF1-like protein n=1 Tax=Phenylobacterium soli TaxID=2170551 RepID=A0A328AHR8_9CAUL|nr:SURF1 family cytochrome oxidase biogenesis protein [Phenylobacterium soli]RAK54189.1 SURF1 family protein [Phenylobacterium soli]
MTEARGGAGRAAFPVGLTIAVAICLAILVGLGVWQLQRLKWKEGLLAHIAALQSAKAVDIGPVMGALGEGRDVDFTRVTAVCPGLATAPFLELDGLRDGQAGVRLISACPVESARYRTVLVDRGFIPDTAAARPKVDAAASAPVRLTGVLRRPDKPNFMAPANQPGHWFTRDVAAMAAALKAAQPAPVFLSAETPTNPELPVLVPAPLPGEIPNRHLEYALTWFGLAAALLGVYAAVLFRRTRA